MREIKNAYFICRFKEFDSELYIDYLEVYEEFRGRGFGKVAVRGLIAQFGVGKPTRLIATNGSERFWESLGFKRKGRYYVYKR